jgi:RES domain-containing protein
MPDAWRIDRVKWASSSFSGLGAALEGGRWNPAGVRVVYASRHLSTAALEKFVHLPKPISTSMGLVQFEIEWNGVKIERPDLKALPGNWRAEPVPAESQDFGAAWFSAGKTAVLAVPSALIPAEENYVINPAHPDFKRIKISPAVPFVFPPRLAVLK